MSTPSSEVEDFFAAHVRDVRKGSGGQRTGRCPFHDDTEASFSFNIDQAVWKCHTGCGEGGLKEFSRRLGLPESAAPSSNGYRAKREIAATYDYKDETGRILFEVVRYTPKHFSQRRPDGAGGWTWNLDGARRVLYRLTELLQADKAKPVFVVEGEKDVENLRGHGLTATCNSGGAGKWRADFGQHFRGLHVVVIPDNDEPGRTHARQVAASLRSVAASVKLLVLPGLTKKGEDVSDWLAAGHTARELMDLAIHAPTYSDDTAEIDAIRLSEHQPAFVRSRAIAEKVSARLHELGRSLKTPGRELFYFWTEKHRLLPISSEGDFPALLDARFGLNPTEKEFRHTLARLEGETRLNAPTAEVRHVAHFDQRAQILYVDIGNGRMARMDGQSIMLQDNGSEQVLFLEEVEPVEPDLKVTDDVRHILFSGLCHDAKAADGATQELILWAWFISTFFADLLPTRPILAVIGSKGSGKGMTLKRPRALLYGTQRAALDSVGDADAFEVGAINRHFFMLDNVDGRIPWLNDELAKVATGIRFTRRVLYTTAETVELSARCFLAITSRTPEFRREDVADRLLLVFLATRKSNTSERVLLGDLENRRPRLWGSLLTELNSCVRHLRDKPMPQTSNQRLADWATLALHLAEKSGEREALDAALTDMDRKRVAFALEDHPLAPFVEQLTDDQWRTAQAIWQAIGGSKGPCKSGRAVAALLRDVQEAGKAAWGLETRAGGHSKVAEYRFRPTAPAPAPAPVTDFPGMEQ